MGPMDDEKGWIERSQRGDDEAFAALVARYQRMVHSLTFRMTGSLTDAEDLAQEIFIQVFKHLQNFRGEAKFSSWLYQVGMNTCLNWKKSRTRRDENQTRWANHEMIFGGRCEAMSPEDEEKTVRVQTALMQLPLKQRAAIVLTVYEEMSHAEAAKTLGCSETTVSWRVFAARNKLKRLLKGGAHK